MYFTVASTLFIALLFIDVDDGMLTATLEQAEYSFLENAAPESVMVCVDLMDTSLNRQVDILLTLRQGSALSKLLPPTFLPIPISHPRATPHSFQWCLILSGNVDFVPETAVITFDPMNSEPIICEMIQLINDIFFEETEQFFVDLSSSDPAVTFIIQSASIFIINDDCK